MSTQQKIITVLIISFIMGSGVMLIILGMNDKRKQILIDFNIAQLQQTATAIIDFENSIISRTVFDYTYWDDLVSYINQPEHEWAESNIKTTIRSFNFDAVWVLNTGNELVYSAYNSEYMSLSHKLFSSEVLEKLYNERFISYSEYTDAGLVLMHGATVHPTNDPGRLTDPAGYFFVAKVWDDSLNHTAKTLSGSNVYASEHAPGSTNQIKDNTIIVSIPLVDANQQVCGYITFARQLNFLRLYTASSRRTLIMFATAIILLLLLQTILLSRWVSRPLRKIGDIIFSENLNDIGKIKRYSSDFNRIGTLIEEFIGQKKELVVEKQRAQESDKLKSAFLANMSHEIRTPLNGILGFSELLLEDETDEETRHSYLNIIQKSGYCLLNIINDLVDLSKLEAGQMKLNIEQFNLDTLLNDTFLFFKENRHVKEHKLELVFNNPFGGMSTILSADQHRLKQVLLNLMNNAAKYTLRGSIEVGCRVYDEKNLLFYVKDTGIGISHDELGKVFDRFIQLNDQRIGQSEGAGLGLSITKGLVELMGGKLWVESELNVGSVFSFTLPAVVNQVAKTTRTLPR